ncbi:MAG: TonB-dependent receptor [Pseudomonadota bacterium]|nr:TonB-dependent receptor [Pseudomonadota bacterium]
MLTVRTLTPRLMGLFGALLALSGLAYASATSGTIKGQVIDDGNLSIPGVLITLSSPALIGGAQQLTADEEGRFIFVELAPGTYEAVAQKQGFGQVRKTNIEVALGRTTQLVMEMKVGAEELTVVAKKPTVDTEKASKGDTFSKEFLSRIPSGRSYQDVVGQTAGVVGGGNPSSGGAATNENTFMLDGTNITDPVTGTFSLNFNFDAIEEIEVITGGFDPEYGESLGAVVSVVTKSGGNSLEVVANVFYSNGDWGPKMDARYTTDGLPLSPTGFDETAQTASMGVVVSGPIVKDKIWFLGSYTFERSLYANVGVQLPRDFEGHYFFSKLTAQPSSAHRFTVQFATNPTTIDNTDQSDTRIYAEAQSRQAQGGYLTSLKWNWFINPETNLETAASFQKTFIESAGVPCTHDGSLGYHPCEPTEEENYTDYETPGHVGLYGAYDSANNPGYYFDDRYRGQLSTKYSLLQVNFLGKHDLKAGVDGSYLLWDQIQGYNGNLIFYDMYENAFDPDTLKNFYWIETSGPSIYRSTGYHVGAFIQDVYKPVENLTVRYGIRYDRAVHRNDAGVPVIDVGLFGPRAYAVWDPWANSKTKIYGGYGRFNDTGRLSVASYLSQSNLGQKVVTGEYFGNSESVAAANAGSYGTDNSVTVLDGTTAPHSDEFSLGAEREVITDIAVGVDFTGKFTRNIYNFDETNLVHDEDGYSYIGSGDGTLDAYYRLRTPSIALRDFYQTDVTIRRNWADRWLLSATYSYVVSRGRVQNGTSSVLSNPAQLDLWYGNLPYDFRHQLKVQAAWDLPIDPWTTTIGMSGQLYSGGPLSRFYYSGADSLSAGGDSYSLLKEPRGEYARAGATWDVSILIEQDIPVRKGKLSATAQIDNLTNNQYPYYLADSYEYYIDTQNRYIIGYRQDTIQAQVGAKYEF